MMKHFLFAAMLLMGTACCAQTTKLPKPNMQRKTLSVMEAFKQRKSTRSYSNKQLSEQDLSDLLWATIGVNRDNGNLTAPTAMNRQEIILYVFTDKEVSLYDPKTHSLTKVADGDHRDIVAGRQDFAKTAPLSLLMVADMGKFGSNNEHARWMVGTDVGIVTQNINLFCAAANLATVTRGTMDQRAIQKLLNLNENQIPVINNPVGYMNE
ncbi:MAG: SagB/ThcOx family dehydrogenase [Bacteroidaceae bacterium]|nr:SagB/ThcOx family dehydrogenase [Bacteroidaceae bacterium]